MLSLDCLTLPDVDPVNLCRIAAAAGFGSVSLWVQPPALFPEMVVTASMERALADILEDTGIAIGNLEVFNLNMTAPIAEFERALAIGAKLGASSATAINYGPSRPDIAERLVEFHDICRQYELKTFIEPISMGQTRTLTDGVALIQSAGVDARLVIDCLHLIRTGGNSETIANVPSEYIGYIQICDGLADIRDEDLNLEATENRLFPGEGHFPLIKILNAVPNHAIIGVETPNKVRMERGVSALDRASAALLASMTIVKQAEATRDRI